MIRKLRQKMLTPVLHELHEFKKNEFTDINNNFSDVNAKMNYLITMMDKNFTYEELLIRKHKLTELCGVDEKDLDLFRKYSCHETINTKDYYVDFMGVKISSNALEIQHLLGTQRFDYGFPDDSLHAEAIEYISLFETIEKTNKDSFVMFELGAGWAPWMTYTAKACLRKGIKNICITGVEGQSNKIPLMLETLNINGITENDKDLIQTYNGIKSTIIFGVISNFDGNVEMEVVPPKDYGASLAGSINSQSIVESVPSYSLKTLMKDYTEVDYVHFDIQGFESDVITSQIEDLNNKVRYMLVGTHTRKIEGELFEFLYNNGWMLLRDTPCIVSKNSYIKDKGFVSMTTMDGAQYWQNTRML